MQQFDWEVPDWIIIPGGNLGNVSALGKGFRMMQELGLIRRAAAAGLRPGRASANPLYLSYLNGFEDFEPGHGAEDAGLAPSRSATRSATRRPSRR